MDTRVDLGGRRNCPLPATFAAVRGSAALGNAQGMVHLPPLTAAYFVAAGVLRPDGVWYTTPLGHRVVIDAGYGGTVTPDGESVEPGTAWAYASGAVHLRLTEMQLVGAFNHETMNMSRNIREVIAQSYGLVVYDPCSVFAVKVEAAGGVIEGS